MTEVNYDAGRLQATYNARDIAFNSFPKRENGHPYMFVIETTIVQRYRVVHQMFQRLLTLHRITFDLNAPNRVLGGPHPSSITIGRPSCHYDYHFAVEAWIFQIRRTFDTLVQYVECVTQSDGQPCDLAFDSIASVLHSNADTNSDVYKIAVGGISSYVSDPTNFLNVVNDLFNSMKHCLAHEETQGMFSNDPNVPSVITYYAKYNQFTNGLTYHNHNAFHLMMGFQDTIDRVLSNLHQFVSQSIALKNETVPQENA